MPGKRNWLWKGSDCREPKHKSPLSQAHYICCLELSHSSRHYQAHLCPWSVVVLEHWQSRQPPSCQESSGRDRIIWTPSMDKPSQGEPSSQGRDTQKESVITHHFPCKSLVPEGGTFFQTKKSASNWGSKGSCNPCSCSSRYKIPFIPEMKRKTISV